VVIVVCGAFQWRSSIDSTAKSDFKIAHATPFSCLPAQPKAVSTALEGTGHVWTSKQAFLQE